MQADTTLAPYPFCGHVPRRKLGASDNLVILVCPPDSVCAGSGLCTGYLLADEAQATAAWNRRATPTPDELSPEFTDTARAALLWVLWHHQGASSPVGQPIRFALGMGQHDRLEPHHLAEAKRWERLHPVNPSVYPAATPLTEAQCDAIAHALDQWGRDRDIHEYGLPVYHDEATKEWRDIIRNAAQGAADA